MGIRKPKTSGLIFHIRNITSFFLDRPWTWPLVLTSLLILVIALLLMTAKSLSVKEDQARVVRVNSVVRHSIENAIYRDQEYLEQVSSSLQNAAELPDSLKRELFKLKRSLAVYSNVFFIDPNGSTVWQLQKIKSGHLVKTDQAKPKWLKNFSHDHSPEPSTLHPLPPGEEEDPDFYISVPVRGDLGHRGSLVATYHHADLLTCCVPIALLQRYFPQIEGPKRAVESWVKSGELSPELYSSQDLTLPPLDLKLRLSMYAWRWNRQLILLALAGIIVFSWLTISTFYQAWIIRRLQTTSTKLRSNRGKLATILQQTPDVVVAADRNGLIRYVNRVEPGYVLDDVIGQDAGAYLDEPYRTTFRQALARAVNEKEIQAVDLISKDNKLPYSSRIAPIIENGQVKEVLIIATPTTALKTAEQQLRLTQFAVDRSIYGALLIDVKGKFIYVNDAAARVLGYSQDELLQMSVF